MIFMAAVCMCAANEGKTSVFFFGGVFFSVVARDISNSNYFDMNVYA